MRNRNTRVISIGSVVIAIVIWWILADTVIRTEVILPSPEQVFRKFIELISAGSGENSLWLNFQTSVVRVLVGWALGLVVGVVLGVAMAASPFVRSAVDPLLEFVRAIPALAFAPLLLVWFGIGELSKILLLFLSALPIFTVSTAASVLGVDISLKRVSQTLGASQFYMITRVMIPAVLPEIFVAMRVASGMVWTTVVAAELVAATEGLGYMILKAGRFLETPTIFVGIITIGIAAFTMDWLIRILQLRLVPWKGKE